MAERSWREPTALLPLRWGAYRARYGCGLALTLGGGVLVQTGSVYAPYLMVVGMAAHLSGWWILPGRGWRRVVVSLPSVVIMMLALNGAVAMPFLILPLAGWLFVRGRPPLGYAVLVLPLASAYVLSLTFAQYGSGALVVAISGLVIVGSAWLARIMAAISTTPSKTPATIS